jgi:hypothetical protein
MKSVGLECTRRDSFATFPSDFFLASAEPLFQFSAFNCALLFEKVVNEPVQTDMTLSHFPPKL